MNTQAECRWRFEPANFSEDGELLEPAWETACGQWCVVTDSTPQADGFANGFEFCPYCGTKLTLLLRRTQVRNCIGVS